MTWCDISQHGAQPWLRQNWVNVASTQKGYNIAGTDFTELSLYVMHIHTNMIWSWEINQTKQLNVVKLSYNSTESVICEAHVWTMVCVNESSLYSLNTIYSYRVYKTNPLSQRPEQATNKLTFKQWNYARGPWCCRFTHWDLGKMSPIAHPTLLDAFPWITMVLVSLKYVIGC